MQDVLFIPMFECRTCAMCLKGAFSAAATTTQTRNTFLNADACAQKGYVMEEVKIAEQHVGQMPS